MRIKNSVMSIVQVAAKSGFSIATVSRAINNPHLVNAKTLLKVNNTINELQYIVQKTGQKRGRKSAKKDVIRHRNVAFLWTGAKPSATSLTGIEMLQGVSMALRAHKVNLLVEHVGSDGQLPEIILNGALDGLLVHGPEPQPEHVHHYRKYPVVWLLSLGSSQWGDRVRPDHEKLGADALSYLVNAGCKNVVCVTYKHQHGTYYTLRSRGFMQKAEELGVVHSLFGTDLVPPMSHITRYGAASLLADQLCQMQPAFDGMFVANELGGYLHEQLCRKGLRPMSDFMMIAGDRDFAPRHLEPAPVLVSVHGIELGRMAVDLLLWRLANPGVSRVQSLLASSLQSQA